MSNNYYDNWERLVRAVLRRELDRQIALIHSDDSSSISSNSSTSRLDHDRSRQRSPLIMNYSDLGLNHSKWKAMLPSDKQELVWTSAYPLSFFLDKRTGKNCFLLGATKITITLEGYRFEIKSHPKSRFTDVAELMDSWELEINTEILSPETLYAAYLVFRFTGENKIPRTENSITRIFSNESNYDDLKEQAKTVHFQKGNGRADGWMEIQLGDFYVGLLGGNGHVIVQLQDTTGCIVEGIEFRPLEKKKNRKGKGIFSNLRIS